MQMYEEAVQLLKGFKQQNDSLNKSIGLEHHSSITLKIRSEQTALQSIIKRID